MTPFKNCRNLHNYANIFVCVTAQIMVTCERRHMKFIAFGALIQFSTYDNIRSKFRFFIIILFREIDFMEGKFFALPRSLIPGAFFSTVTVQNLDNYADKFRV